MGALSIFFVKHNAVCNLIVKYSAFETGLPIPFNIFTWQKNFLQNVLAFGRALLAEHTYTKIYVIKTHINLVKDQCLID